MSDVLNLQGSETEAAAAEKASNVSTIACAKQMCSSISCFNC